MDGGANGPRTEPPEKFAESVDIVVEHAHYGAKPYGGARRGKGRHVRADYHYLARYHACHASEEYALTLDGVRKKRRGERHRGPSGYLLHDVGERLASGWLADVLERKGYHRAFQKDSQHRSIRR